MRIVAVSDIHGHFQALLTALKESGFVPSASDHLLVVCGDCFDRGHENMKVFRFLNELENKIIVRGNHEDLLQEVLMGRKLDDSDFYNGTDMTMYEFVQKDNGDFMNGDEVAEARENLYLPFLDSTVNYFETKNYIFVHGWLPYDYDEKGKPVLVDYKTADEDQWYEARWTSWRAAIINNLLFNGSKTLICGHLATQEAYESDKSRLPKDSSVYYGDNFIAIDAHVMSSDRINALVINDELSDD